MKEPTNRSHPIANIESTSTERYVCERASGRERASEQERARKKARDQSGPEVP